MVRAAPTSLISWLVARGPADATGRARWRLNSLELGALGEELASRHLRSLGFRLVGRNVRAAEAELDIVGIEGRTLVVIEVKAGWWPVPMPNDGLEGRPTTWQHRRPGSRVTEEALARRRGAARRLARGEGLDDGRVDVVEVITGRGPQPILFHHRRFNAGSFPDQARDPIYKIRPTMRP